MIRAVFGGSFDPVHFGHLKAVLAIRERRLADVVHIVPAWLSPHKASSGASPEHRLAMTGLAFGGREGLVIESMEVDRGAPAYSVDTLLELKERFPGDDFRLVMGADQLRAFGSWRLPDRILELSELIILERQSGVLEALCAQAGIASSAYHLLSDFDERVSASAIRGKLAAGEDSAEWLDPAVADYIHKHRLYLR